MVTPQGVALIAELIAGLFLFVGIVGFGIRRTKPWLVVSVLAAATLITTVTVIVESST
jgi:hypothetical protein